MRSRSILVAPCHPDLRVYAKGLCKACYMKELRETPRSQIRRQEHKWWSLNVKYMLTDRLYPMTVDRLHTMIATQNGVCKSCGQVNENDKDGHPYPLHLNWNLETGIVRGLVCNRCHVVLTHPINSLTYPDNPNHIRSFIKSHEDQVEYYNKVANFADTIMMLD